MHIGVIKEKCKFENRVAITPDIAKKYSQLNLNVLVEKNSGLEAGYSDEKYVTAGSKICETEEEVISQSDILVTVSTLPEIKSSYKIKSNLIIIGLLSPYENKKYIKSIAIKNINCIAMELMPRITRAQSMDALSSQSNLAGYRAVIDAAYLINKALPMMMTAAGTIIPAKILILGAGVAGLQAIATAKRLGGIVSAFDVRPEVEEQVKSLGAKFISVETSKESNVKEKSVYAKEMDDKYKLMQIKKIEDAAQESDIIISTALIPGKKSPLLIPYSTLEKMKTGSVIVDLAGVAGGNCEATKYGETYSYKGVLVSGPINLASMIASDSSALYAKNIFNLISLIINDENNINIDMNDEIIAKSILIKDGKLTNII